MSQDERQSADWDIKSAPRNYFALLVAQFASATFAFASVWILTRFSGSKGYGTVVAIIAASQIVQVFVNWSGYSLVRFGTEEFNSTARISGIFWLRFWILIPNLIGVLGTSGLWFGPLSQLLSLEPDWYWLVTLHFSAAAIWLHLQFALQGAKLPRILGALQAMERALTFVAILTLALFGQIDPKSAMICYAVSPLISTFVAFVWIRRLVSLRDAVACLDRLREVLSYSLPLIPFTLVGYFSGSYLDAIFISKILSTSDLGVYSVATQISGIALQVPTLANTLLLPMFITIRQHSRHDQLDGFFQHVVPTVAVLWGIVCALGAFFAVLFIPLIFGDDFREAGSPLWILLSASVVGIPALIGYFALAHSESATYISMVSAVGSAATNVGLDVLLIPRLGLVGCAWATLGAFAVSVVVHLVFLRRIRRIPSSWTVAAIMPSVTGSVVLSFTAQPYLAFTLTMLLSLLIIGLYRRSILTTTRLVRSIRSDRQLKVTDADF